MIYLTTIVMNACKRKNHAVNEHNTNRKILSSNACLDSVRSIWVSILNYKQNGIKMNSAAEVKTLSTRKSRW